MIGSSRFAVVAPRQAQTWQCPDGLESEAQQLTAKEEGAIASHGISSPAAPSRQCEKKEQTVPALTTITGGAANAIITPAQFQDVRIGIKFIIAIHVFNSVCQTETLLA